MAARRAHNPEVAGASPAPAIDFFPDLIIHRSLENLTVLIIAVKGLEPPTQRI